MVVSLLPLSQIPTNVVALKNISLLFYSLVDQKSEKSPNWAKIRVLAGRCSFRKDSKRESFFFKVKNYLFIYLLPFPASGGHLYFLTHGPLNLTSKPSMVDGVHCITLTFSILSFSHFY